MSEWKNDGEQVRSCFCIGPQNGEPECPCRMRNRPLMTNDELFDLLMKFRDERIGRRKKAERRTAR
jgi:hypothetical protein